MRVREIDCFSWCGICILSIHNLFCQNNQISQERMPRIYVSVVESSREQQEVDASSVRVVKEYLVVFPEELPGLPPQRELEF